MTYEVKDLSGELIKGSFYEPELQKILKTRKRGGKIEYLVSWKGYPSKFNSWVDEITLL